MNELLTFLRDFDLHTLVSFGILSWFIMRSFRKEIQEEIKEIRLEISQIRLENAQQCARSDRLYEMFIDLLKDGRKK